MTFSDTHKGGGGIRSVGLAAMDAPPANGWTCGLCKRALAGATASLVRCLFLLATLCLAGFVNGGVTEYENRFRVYNAGTGDCSHAGAIWSSVQIFELTSWDYWGWGTAIKFGVFLDDGQIVVAPPLDHWTGAEGAVWVRMKKGQLITSANTVGATRCLFDNLDASRPRLEEQSFTLPRTAGYETVYLCFGQDDGTTLGWVCLQVSLYDAYVMSDLTVTGVQSLRTGTKTYVAVPDPPVDPLTFLEGGIRQTNIYVDASVAASGDGCSWDAPLRTVQEAVDAVRLDGTVVHVRPGVYGPVQVSKMKFTTNNVACTFTVESTCGPAVTVLDGGGIVGDESSVMGKANAAFGFAEETPAPRDLLRGFTLRGAIHGVTAGRVENCIVSNCWFGVYGLRTEARNCLIVDNLRIGAACRSISNCTVSRNWTGATIPDAYDSIVWGNRADNFAYPYNRGAGCCTEPALAGISSSLAADPRFVDAEHGDFRLRGDSPCRDAGTGAEPDGFDLAGNRRVQGDSVDIGCYEYGAGRDGTTATTPVAVPHAWLDACTNLPDGVGADYEARAFLTGGKRAAGGAPLALWQEYVQGTDPNDSNDVFRVFLTATNGLAVSWSPDLGPARRYTLYGADALTNRVWAATGVFDDAGFLATNRFFKVGVDWQ